ncbi:hypothetical protein [Nitrosomonas sp.]|nr:hypothetical protein [Nitrosomonas sp.]
MVDSQSPATHDLNALIAVNPEIESYMRSLLTQADHLFSQK